MMMVVMVVMVMVMVVVMVMMVMMVNRRRCAPGPELRGGEVRGAVPVRTSIAALGTGDFIVAPTTALKKEGVEGGLAGGWAVVEPRGRAVHADLIQSHSEVTRAIMVGGQPMVFALAMIAYRVGVVRTELREQAEVHPLPLAAAATTSPTVCETAQRSL